MTTDDRDASTWESGPSDPPRLADGPGTAVQVDIDAPPAAVWAMVTDIDMPAEFSDEFMGARWADGFDGPALGAKFIGSNTHSAIGTWRVPCFVNRYEEDTEFGWVTTDPDNPGARWCFELSSTGGSTRLRYSVVLGPGPSGLDGAIAARPHKEPQIIAGRIAELRANMQRVVEGVRDALKSADD